MRCNHQHPYCVWTRDEALFERATVHTVGVRRHWDCILCGPHCETLDLERRSYPTTVYQPPSYKKGEQCGPSNRVKKLIKPE